ncbi:endolytic transglycosylase MltG [Thalassobaculum sp. OXR-137]|uniref:endolytic transglycosylase MltG n=1 Tax=Thalassobaculum sp. OXR-137 TaxID=3100173 RepID=UPI002AC987C6|nr:endolytic transglycosylase MltG [Thalassobaculum sp. OXR-137]WPZ33653.1 endolytic transglycosylase MltG [Thalassobaculum sp. OXR-137]
MGRWLLRLASLLLSAAVIAGFAGVWAWTEFTRPGPLAAETTVVIPRGAGMETIAHRLHEAGVITDPRILALGAKVTGQARRLKAGEFAFPASVSPQHALDILESGVTVVRRVTVAEGLSSAQVVAVVEAADGLEGEIGDVPLEGTLLPETYHYAFGDSRAAIVARMRSEMDRTLRTLWETRAPDLPIASPQEAVILASIVEKETGVAAERPLVASVFVNRLNRGMRLQSDPTVAYGIAGGEGLDRPLTRTDLKSETPYNTYVIDGLPPGPIANPGAASIAAVLQPAESDFLYFVADGTGGHAFAKTLAEHNSNVRAWRKYQRDNRAE